MNKRDYDFLSKIELLRAIDERICLLDHIATEFDYLEKDVDRLSKDLLDLSDEVEADVLDYLNGLVAEVRIYAKKARPSM